MPKDNIKGIRPAKVARSTKAHSITLDVSQLSDVQRVDLQKQLKELAAARFPGGVGSLIGAEGGHTSHNDTDGWF